MIYLGDCFEVLKTLEDSSIDSLITDPPAGISFMGKEWDDHKGGREHWIEWMSQVMKECLRVLKPGAHGLIWAIPRTSHWTATAIENAGFEIRDIVHHLFGSGFPKSLNISKAIDKVKWDDLKAKQWDGWGTALKPACEHWVLVRKPISEKNVAENVLKWDCGGINVDGCRVETTDKTWSIPPSGKEYENCIYVYKEKKGSNSNSMFKKKGLGREGSPIGRFPANLILSHNEDCETVSNYECTEGCAVRELDEQSGILKSGSRNHPSKGFEFFSDKKSSDKLFKCESLEAGASRFFYCAKASTSDRNEGCDGLEKKEKPTLGEFKHPGTNGRISPKSGSIPRSNHHPTVKSTKLMSYLIKLITPPGGIILDPFMGSGSTGKSAYLNHFEFIGIEKEADYFEIAQARIDYVLGLSKVNNQQLCMEEFEREAYV